MVNHCFLCLSGADLRS